MGNNQSLERATGSELQLDRNNSAIGVLNEQDNKLWNDMRAKQAQETNSALPQLKLTEDNFSRNDNSAIFANANAAVRQFLAAKSLERLGQDVATGVAQGITSTTDNMSADWHSSNPDDSSAASQLSREAASIPQSMANGVVLEMSSTSRGKSSLPPAADARSEESPSGEQSSLSRESDNMLRNSLEGRTGRLPYDETDDSLGTASRSEQQSDGLPQPDNKSRWTQELDDLVNRVLEGVGNSIVSPPERGEPNHPGFAPSYERMFPYKDREWQA